jgi:hypothetical protein
MNVTLNEFRAAIKAAHATTTAKWSEQILAADRATGRAGALKGHARWNHDIAAGRGIRARVVRGFRADLGAALAPIRAEWDALPLVEVSTRETIGASSTWEIRKVLPDGSTARRDALHWEWRDGVWPMQALGR